MKKYVVIFLMITCFSANAEDKTRKFFLHIPVGIFVPTGSQSDMKNTIEFTAGLDVQYYFNDYIGFALNRDIGFNKAGGADFYTSFSGTGIAFKKSWASNDVYFNGGFAFVGSFIDGDSYDSSLGGYADMGWRWFPTKHLFIGIGARYLYAGDIHYREFTYRQKGFSAMGLVGVGF